MSESCVCGQERWQRTDAGEFICAACGTVVAAPLASPARSLAEAVHEAVEAWIGIHERQVGAAEWARFRDAMAALTRIDTPAEGGER